MKALNPMQILITILFLCLLMAGVAFIGFWQYWHLKEEIKANQTNAAVQVQTK